MSKTWPKELGNHPRSRIFFRWIYLGIASGRYILLIRKWAAAVRSLCTVTVATCYHEWNKYILLICLSPNCSVAIRKSAMNVIQRTVTGQSESDSGRQGASECVAGAKNVNSLVRLVSSPDNQCTVGVDEDVVSR